MTHSSDVGVRKLLPEGCSFAGANPSGIRFRSFTWRARWAAIGAAIAVVAGTGGVAFSGATNAQITPSQTLITPCRIMDTRSGPNNVGPRSTPLAGGETYSIQMTGTNGNCTIPSGTSGVVMNVTIVGPGSNGFLTVFPGGATRPTASNLNYVTGQAPTPNQVTVALGATGQVSFYASGGPVNVIADVAGYTTTARLTNAQLAQNRWDQDLARPTTLPVGTGPYGMAFDGTNVWVANAGANVVTRIDPTTNSVVGSPIVVGSEPTGLAFDGTNIWVTNQDSGTVTRINAATGTVVGSAITVGSSPFGLAFDGTNMWVTKFAGNSVQRISAATGNLVGSPITVGAGPSAIVFDGTTMWVANTNANSVTRINASTATVTGSAITVGSLPFALAFDGTSVWAGNYTSNTVSRIDATSATVVSPPITVGTGPRGMTFDGQSIWVACQGSGSVTRIDAATATVVGSAISTGLQPAGMTFDGTSIWTANQASATVAKLRAG